MVSGVFYYFNSILNPILYSIMSKRFRRGFNDISGNCKLFKVKMVSFYLINVDRVIPALGGQELRGVQSEDGRV